MALLIAGLRTPLPGVALAINMTVAGLTANTGARFFAQDGGYELALVLSAARPAFALGGPGRWSPDARFLSRLQPDHGYADDQPTGRFTHAPPETAQEQALRRSRRAPPAGRGDAPPSPRG